MTSPEDLLRELAPQVLGVIARRYGDFASAEDAVQEALLAAALSWPTEGTPENPLGWLIRVAARRMTDQYRSDDSRRRRELLAASWSSPASPSPFTDPGPAPGQDDTLILMYLCCHPALAPGSAIPLTLRAVGGLTTRELAAAFLLPEPTMGQRISRAKATLKATAEPFRLPPPEQRADRLRSVLHVLYLLFNEGYTSSSGPDLARTDLSGEAIRLARMLRASLPDDPEVAGLLALMLLTEARRQARTGPGGELIPLAEQQRGCWDRALIIEGLALVTEALRRGPGRPASTSCRRPSRPCTTRRAGRRTPTGRRSCALYRVLERMTGNPMVTLNRAAAAAMADGPGAGLAILDTVAAQLGDHHRYLSVRAHLLEQAGDRAAARAGFQAAAARATNLREQQYLITKAARLTG